MHDQNYHGRTGIYIYIYMYMHEHRSFGYLVFLDDGQTDQGNGKKKFPTSSD